MVDETASAAHAGAARNVSDVDELDFQPALIRLSASAPSPLGRLVLWVILWFIVMLVAASFIGRLDIVAVADGKLVPGSYLKIVQPAEAGVVKEILVGEGEIGRAHV